MPPADRASARQNRGLPPKLLPSTTGGEAGYRLGATYVFGNRDFLPFAAGAGGPICTDDVCFVP